MTTLGEIAAAFIGFSMVAGVLRPESNSMQRRLFRFRHVAESSLAAVVVAFLPLLLYAYGFSAQTVWRAASAICLVPATLAPIFNWREVGVADSYNAEPARTAASILLNVVMVCILLSNVGLPGPSSGARYVTVLVLLLTLAGLIFVGATFGALRSPPAA